MQAAFCKWIGLSSGLFPIVSFSMPKPLSQITKSFFSSFHPAMNRRRSLFEWFSPFQYGCQKHKGSTRSLGKKGLLSRPNGFRVSDDFFVSILLVDLGPLRLTPASKRIDCSSWSDGLAIWNYSRFRLRFVKIKKTTRAKYPANSLVKRNFLPKVQKIPWNLGRGFAFTWRNYFCASH